MANHLGVYIWVEAVNQNNRAEQNIWCMQNEESMDASMWNLKNEVKSKKKKIPSLKRVNRNLLLLVSMCTCISSWIISSVCQRRKKSGCINYYYKHCMKMDKNRNIWYLMMWFDFIFTIVPSIACASVISTKCKIIHLRGTATSVCWCVHVWVGVRWGAIACESLMQMRTKSETPFDMNMYNVYINIYEYIIYTYIEICSHIYFLYMLFYVY